MFRYLTALLSILALAPAHGQDAASPLEMQTVAPLPLAGAGKPEEALAGDRFLLPMTLRNRTDAPMTLRRIVFQVPEGIELIDPDIDGVDNDRDGLVDEGGEGFSRSEQGTVAWRIPDAAPPIAAGQSVERAVALRLSPDAEPGSASTLTLRAAASAAETPVRVEQSVAFALAPPEIAISVDDTSLPLAFAATDKPMLRAVLTLPSGEIEGLGLRVSGSAALAAFEAVRVTTGAGVSCTALPDDMAQTTSINAGFGTCAVDRATPLSDRTVTVEARLALRDADPFDGAAAIAERRALSLDAMMMKGDVALGPEASFTGTLTGPLVGARLLSMTEKPVDAGDAVAARWRLVNRGDAPAEGLRLIAEESAFDCASIALFDGDDGEACGDGLALAALDPDADREIELSARLSDDAALDAETALRLSQVGDGLAPTPLPPAAPVLMLPPAPFLSVDADSEWNADGEIITARIGDGGSVRFSGTLPEGRFDAALILRSRAVDAATGLPLAPAPLRVDRFEARPRGEARFDASAAPVLRTEDGWSITALPLADVIVPIASEDADAAGYGGTARLVFRDTEAIQADRLIEIALQLDVFGRQTDAAESVAEVLVVEPSLDLTMRSPDTDRSLDLHESARIATLTCNRGHASARSLVLKVTLPEGIALDDRQPPSLFGVPAAQIDKPEAVFAADPVSLGEVDFDAQTGVLRGVLDPERVVSPERCLAMTFDIRRDEMNRPAQGSATLLASIDPFTGRDGPAARVYPAMGGGELRFSLPFLHFGPDSEVALSTQRLVSHAALLEIPEAAGSHRVTLSTRSSAGLDWTILREDDSGARTPWRDGTELPAGEVVRLRMEALAPPARPLGWTDTTVVEALALPRQTAPLASPLAASARLITRRSQPEGGRIEVTKTMALDRDCDGGLGDERGQDALFEPVKDAAPGDCVIFRVAFRHGGDKSMERIVVRDLVPEGTILREGALEIVRPPEPLDGSEITPPGPDSRDLVWRFDGLFEPGAEGEVGYAVQLLE